MVVQVKTIFIDGLSTSWSEEHVRDLLKRYGKLERIELARNMPSARRKDFGFVTFDTHEAAVTCAKSINNSELGEGEDKVYSYLNGLSLFTQVYSFCLIRSFFLGKSEGTLI